MPVKKRRKPKGPTQEVVAKALRHPTRVKILTALDGREVSPNSLSEELGMPLGSVAYHVRALASLELIELTRTQPVRGAMEHFYTARGRGLIVWTTGNGDLRLLADQISAEARRIRLERIGEPTDGPHVEFDDLPEEDQRNWLDVAAAVERLGGIPA